VSTGPRQQTPAGVVVVDKPAGWTSHDVVARVRRLAGTRKVGHAGTLDPMATGVLVVGVGKATRLLGYLALGDKTYEATIRLGASTVTDDAEGEVTATADASAVTDDDLAAGVRALTGDLEQVPSAVSAVKVGGRRSYARVRGGEEVALTARPVQVSAFDVLAVRRHPGPLDGGRLDGGRVDVDVRVTCSSGTYVRALARDLGAGLGVGGHLTRLRRTRAGGFGLSQAATLDDLDRDLRVVSLADVARRHFATHQASAEEAERVRNGRPLADVRLAGEGPVAVMTAEGEFLALYEQRGPQARAAAVFA